MCTPGPWWRPPLPHVRIRESGASSARGWRRPAGLRLAGGVIRPSRTRRTQEAAAQRELARGRRPPAGALHALSRGHGLDDPVPAVAVLVCRVPTARRRSAGLRADARRLGRPGGRARAVHSRAGGDPTHPPRRHGRHTRTRRRVPVVGGPHSGSRSGAYRKTKSRSARAAAPRTVRARRISAGWPSAGPGADPGESKAETVRDWPGRSRNRPHPGRQGCGRDRLARSLPGDRRRGAEVAA